MRSIHQAPWRCSKLHDDLNEKENILFRWIETPNGGVTAVPTSAGQAKRAGARCTLREDWENVKNNIMLDILRAKFTQHAELRQKLLATGDAILIEGNTWHDRSTLLLKPSAKLKSKRTSENDLLEVD